MTKPKKTSPSSELKNNQTQEVEETAIQIQTPAQVQAQDEQRFLPSFPTKAQLEEYKAFLNNYNSFVDEMLNEEVDYGMIPSVDKPSLFKPGAEKLEKLFFYRHKKVLVEKVVEPDYIKYTYRTEVYNKAGNLVATCEGTCNSHEKKYRWRVIPEWEASEEIKASVEPEARKAKSGKTYKWYKVENTEVADLENTIMKMAQKRSYVGAILEATNSSGRFTQDVEDMDLGRVSRNQNATRRATRASGGSKWQNEYQGSAGTPKSPKTGKYGEPLEEGEQPEQEDEIPIIDADDDFQEQEKVNKFKEKVSEGQNPSMIYKCKDCGVTISEKVRDYSEKYYGKGICMDCQKKSRKIT